MGQPLPAPLTVLVTEDGAPAAGATVAWSTTAAGGAVDPTSAAADANGIASTTWTLGTAAGGQTATATLSGASGSPVSFTATAVAGAAAVIAEAGGNNQTGEINTTLPLPLQAGVTDAFGNPVAGTNVDWAPSGGSDATVSAPSVASNTSGISQVSVMLGGTTGPITIEAVSIGLTGSPLTFNATAIEAVPVPATASVTVDNNIFVSDRNGTQNPAVDTVMTGGTVTWTWAVGAVPHDVTSTGSPSFDSSTLQAAPASHQFTFTAPGTYNYYCTQHGAGLPTPAGMWGRIVVR